MAYVDDEWTSTAKYRFNPNGSPLDVHVTFAEGTYELEAPLVFTLAESGTEAHSITYTAALGKTAVLSGGRRITGWKRAGERKWTAEVLGQVSRIAAQTALDAERLVEIGADPARVTISGNLKFDVRLPPGQAEAGQAIRRSWGAQRPVPLAGSTHEGDELPLLQAFPRLLETWPDALLVLAPRRPERFGRAAQLARNAGLSVSLRSAGIVVPPGIQCLVIDSTGELQTFYAACDVAFVGGSLEPHGGHNVLEAAALSRPVLVGPHTFNFEEITRQLVTIGAALRVRDDDELHAAL